MKKKGRRSRKSRLTNQMDLEMLGLEIGKRIRKVRLEHHMNQDMFGLKIGYPKSTISKYENGILVPRTAALVAIHEEFGIDLNWLILGREPKKDNEGILTKQVKDLSVKNQELQKELIEATTNLVEILSKKD